MSAAPSSVASLVTSFTTRDPGHPRVTWYAHGERIELSGAVLANWVAKTGNLLVEEADLTSGGLVLIEMPLHWRTITTALGAWAVGGRTQWVAPGTAQEVLSSTGAEAAVLVTSQPVHGLSVGSGVGPVVVGCPAVSMVRTWAPEDGQVDVDLAASVAGFDDRLLYPDPSGGGDALRRCGEIARSKGWQPGGRFLLDTLMPQADPLLAVLAVLALPGSLVLTQIDDAERVAAIRAQEQVDGTVDL